MVFIQGCRPDEDGWDVPRLYANAAARGQRYKIVMANPSLQKDFPTAKTFSSAATIGETELYDLEKDPGEQHNIAAEHPDLVFKMRRRYEAWFFDVMRGLNPPVQNYIGTSHENPVLLAAQDMRGPHALAAPWNWGHVHRMAKTEPAGAGYYELQVARDGRYRFTLSYGPPGNERIPALKQGSAFLGIGGITEEKSIEAGASSVIFEMDLKAGGCRLDALFTGQRSDQEAVAPFLVNIEYIQKRSA